MWIIHWPWSLRSSFALPVPGVNNVIFADSGEIHGFRNEFLRPSVRSAVRRKTSTRRCRPKKAVCAGLWFLPIITKKASGISFCCCARCSKKFCSVVAVPVPFWKLLVVPGPSPVATKPFTTYLGPNFLLNKVIVVNSLQFVHHIFINASGDPPLRYHTFRTGVSTHQVACLSDLWVKYTNAPGLNSCDWNVEDFHQLEKGADRRCFCRTQVMSIVPVSRDGLPNRLNQKNES